jgi:hypothetical protein
METLLADEVQGYGISAYEHAEEALLLCNKRGIHNSVSQKGEST